MKLRNLGLLTMLISLFILGACEKPSNIGLDIDPSLDSDTISLDLVSKLQKEDSIATNYTTASILAYMNDPEFGITKSDLALALSLPSSNVNFGTNVQLDSAVLILPYLGLYGDSTIYQVEVRQLNESLYANTIPYYYNTKTWAKKTDLWAAQNFIPKYRDSINIRLYGDQDSIIKVIPQLRIALNKTLITDNIINKDSATLSTSLNFANAFKGLYLSLNNTNITSNKGAAVLFDAYTNGATRLELYYRSTNSKGTIDTTTLALPVVGSSGSAVSSIEWDLTGSAAEAEINNPTLNNAKLYFKSLGGTKAKIEFPNLSQINSLGTNVVINRAEIVFKVAQGTTIPFTAIPLLKIHRWDIANIKQLIPDENPNDPRYLGQGMVGGFYNSANSTYSINVTGYVQDLLRGRTTNYGTFISPFDYASTTSKLNSPGRVIVGGGGSTTANKLKLKIYYTIHQ